MIPVLDDNGDLFDVFSKYDFSIIGNSGSIDLSMKIEDVIKQRPAYVEGCVTMPQCCTIG